MRTTTRDRKMNVLIFEYALELVDVSNDITNEFSTMIHKKNERSKIYRGASSRIYDGQRVLAKDYWMSDRDEQSPPYNL